MSFLKKLSSLASPEVVILTAFVETSDENFAQMALFPLQYLAGHSNGNIILMKFSLLTVNAVVILTTFEAISDDNFMEMTIFPYH